MSGVDISARPVAELVQAVVGGDSDAFAPLVTRYFGMVYAIALAGVGQREVAEDLTQETFVRAYLGLARLKNPVAFPAWLSRIARNMALDWRRRDQRASTFLSLIDINAEHLQIPDDRIVPANRRMEMEESQTELGQLIDRLPLEQREVLLLHFMEGLGQRDMAHLLGLSQAKVSRMLRRALAALRASLDERMRQELGRMQARPGAQARTLGFIGAVTALPLAAKASLAAASAQALPVLAASTNSPIGAGLFGWAKVVQVFYATGSKTMIAIKSVATLLGALSVMTVVGVNVNQSRAQQANRDVAHVETPAPIVAQTRRVGFARSTTRADGPDFRSTQKIGVCVVAQL